MVKKKLPHLLIVGGTGFIGYHVALFAKKKGWKVSSVSLHKPQEHRQVKGVTYLTIDITDFKTLYLFFWNADFFDDISSFQLHFRF